MSFSNLGTGIQNLIMGVIYAVILLAVGIALGPTVIQYAAYINTTALATVPLGGVIVLLATYISTFYYLGIVMGMILMIWATVHYRSG
jgi:hypothetical protein